MFNPEMMAMAQDMMSKMTPEQMAQMQQMAQNMPPEMMQAAMSQMQNATPEQVRQMRSATAGMSGDAFASQAAAQMGGGAQQPGGGAQQPAVQAAAALKQQGNQLHGERAFSQAADAYQRAIARLEGATGAQASELRVSCQSNLASCFLQLERWQECVDACDTVLAADARNRKAHYRRGQALCALRRYEAAVADLERAAALSPESERAIIRAKLTEAQQGLKQASQGVVIEDVTKSAPQPRAEGLAASDAAPPPLNPVPAEAPPPAGAAPSLATPAASAAAPPPFVPPGADPQHMQQAAEMLRSNPEMAKQAAAAMAAMSDEQLAAMAAQSGMPGVTPEMAKQAAAMMRSLPPEQLAAMASAQAGAATAGGRPAGPAAPAAAAAAAPPPDQLAAAAAAMKQDPGMLRQAAAMMEGMSEEELAAMARMAPGAAGMQVDPAQMKMAARMMANMSPEDMERMGRMAAGMGMGVPGAAAPAAAAVAGAAGAGASAAAEAALAGFPAGGFGSAPPGMMEDMRKRMQDPEMLKMMRNMMRSMDPQQLSEMMGASGLKVTPEQAKSVVEKLDGFSDKHLEIMARLMGWINAALEAYRAAKAWALSQGALAIAVAVLVLALLLRWLGWM